MDKTEITIIIYFLVLIIFSIFYVINFFQFYRYIIKFRKRVNELYPNTFKIILFQEPRLVRGALKSGLISLNPLHIFSWNKMRELLFFGVNENAKNDDIIIKYCYKIKTYYKICGLTLVIFLGIIFIPTLLNFFK